MDHDDKCYWPFEVLLSDQQSEQHRKEIRFLQSAAELGYRPYTFGNGNFGATCGERYGILFARGRGRWESLLSVGERRTASAYFDDFTGASKAILLWLKGLDAETVVTNIQNQVISIPGCPRGFVLHGPDE